MEIVVLGIATGFGLWCLFSLLGFTVWQLINLIKKNT